MGSKRLRPLAKMLLLLHPFLGLSPCPQVLNLDGLLPNNHDVYATVAVEGGVFLGLTNAADDDAIAITTLVYQILLNSIGAVLGQGDVVIGATTDVSRTFQVDLQITTGLEHFSKSVQTTSGFLGDVVLSCVKEHRMGTNNAAVRNGFIVESGGNKLFNGFVGINDSATVNKQGTGLQSSKLLQSGLTLLVVSKGHEVHGHAGVSSIQCIQAGHGVGTEVFIAVREEHNSALAGQLGNNLAGSGEAGAQGSQAAIDVAIVTNGIHFFLNLSSVPRTRSNYRSVGGEGAYAQDSLGKAPLLIVTPQNTRIELYTTLLKYGANPKAKDLYGDTPLHIATITGVNPEIVEQLIFAGADVNERNKKGVTPLALAVEHQTLHIANLACPTKKFTEIPLNMTLRLFIYSPK